MKTPEGEAAHRGIGVFQVGELVRRNGWTVEDLDATLLAGGDDDRDGITVPGVVRFRGRPT